MPRKKISFEYLKSLFPRYEPLGHKPEKATKKGYVHNHRPTWKPPKPSMSPAEWKRRRRAARLRASA